MSLSERDNLGTNGKLLNRVQPKTESPPMRWLETQNITSAVKLLTRIMLIFEWETTEFQARHLHEHQKDPILAPSLTSDLHYGVPCLFEGRA